MKLVSSIIVVALPVRFFLNTHALRQGGKRPVQIPSMPVTVTGELDADEGMVREKVLAKPAMLKRSRPILFHRSCPLLAKLSHRKAKGKRQHQSGLMHNRSGTQNETQIGQPTLTPNPRGKALPSSQYVPAAKTHPAKVPTASQDTNASRIEAGTAVSAIAAVHADLASEVQGANTTKASIVSRLVNAAKFHLNKHGHLDHDGRVLKSSILLGIALVGFITIQVAALAFVAWHAHMSMGMLSESCDPNPSMLRKASRKWDLLPGFVSWKDWLPPENRQTAANLPSQAEPGGAFNRGTVDWKTWASKQRNANDVGRAVNKSKFQDKSFIEEKQGAPCRSGSPTGGLDKGESHPSMRRDKESADAIESADAAAPKQLDINKRVSDVLDRSQKETMSLLSMLGEEYAAMADVEYGKQGTGRR